MARGMKSRRGGARRRGPLWCLLAAVPATGIGLGLALQELRGELAAPELPGAAPAAVPPTWARLEATGAAGVPGVPASARTAWPPPVTAADVLRTRAAALLAGGAVESGEWEALLDELVAEGTRETLGLALELMEDPRCSFPYRASYFAQLLDGVEDDRIAAVALRLVERELESGAGSRFEMDGYLDLVAPRGGEWAGDLLAGMIDRGGPARRAAARRVSLLGATASAEPFLEFVRDGDAVGPHAAGEIAVGLASWGDDAVDASLLELARDARTPERVRRLLYPSQAHFSTTAQVAAFGAHYDSAPTDGARAAVLAALRVLGREERVRRDLVRSVAAPLLERGLESLSEPIWREAVSVLDDRPEFHTARTVATLEWNLAGMIEGEDRRLASEALRRGREELRRSEPRGR